jgi:hypothetical protein
MCGGGSTTAEALEAPLEHARFLAESGSTRSPADLYCSSITSRASVQRSSAKSRRIASNAPLHAALMHPGVLMFLGSGGRQQSAKDGHVR